MRQALAGMVAKAESKSSYASKHKLYPGQDRHNLSNHTVSFHNIFPYLSIDSAFEVKFEIHAHGDLTDQGEHHYRDELRVHVWRKLATFMLMSEKVSNYSENSAGCLYRYMPFRPYYLRASSAFGFHVDRLLLTPRTIPVGNSIPHARTCIRICTHSMESFVAH